MELTKHIVMMIRYIVHFVVADIGAETCYSHAVVKHGHFGEHICVFPTSSTTVTSNNSKCLIVAKVLECANLVASLVNNVKGNPAFA